MAHNYVVTAQHPTTVNVCDTVSRLILVMLLLSIVIFIITGKLYQPYRLEPDHCKEYQDRNPLSEPRGFEEHQGVQHQWEH